MSALPNQILPGIEHVVVVMFENRSFDNMLGGLYPNKTQNEYNGVQPGMNNPDNPYVPTSKRIPVWQDQTSLDAMIMPYPDPGELFADMNEQIFAPNPIPPSGPGKPTMGGFLFNYKNQKVNPGGPAPVGRDILQYYAPGPNGNIPVMTALAKAYAVSDTWFASGPVQTLVNRIFAHSGQPSTYTKNGQTYNCIDNTTVTNQHYYPLGQVNVRTVFELLDDKFGGNQTNWKVYYNDVPLSALIDYVYEHWGPLQPNVCRYDEYFASDIANNTLPAYSFIEPRYTNMAWDSVCQATNPSYQPSSYHPGGACPAWDPNAPDNPPPVSVCFGEMFLADIYKQLASNPELFKKTLLIVTFDEHGGLFDHQSPPAAVPPLANVANFDYSRYGVRVPAIFINPYIKSGTIFRPIPNSNTPHPFDHTSIISTLWKHFGLSDPLTPRVLRAPTFAGIINSKTMNPFTPGDLVPLSCKVPPDSAKGIAKVDPEDANSIYSVILRGMQQATLDGKMLK